MIKIVKSKFFLVCLFFFFLFQSCTSTDIEKKNNDLQGNSSSQNKKSNKHSKTDYIEENAQDSKKLRFIDWKYKGFGLELPNWIDFVFDDDLTKLRQNYDEFTDETQFIVIKDFGMNSDQAENSAKIKYEELKSNNEEFEKTYTLFDHFWVKLNFENQSNKETFSDFIARPYVSLYLFYSLKNE